MDSPIASHFIEHDICTLMVLSIGGKVPPGVKVKRTSGWKTPLLRDRAFEIDAGIARSPVDWMRKGPEIKAFWSTVYSQSLWNSPLFIYPHYSCMKLLRYHLLGFIQYFPTSMQLLY